MTHPNATPVKAIYLDEFIYEEGTPIGKCYQCDLPNPFTNNQVLTEGVDYVKQWHVKPGGQTNWINVDEATYEIYYNQDRRRIIALPLHAEKREGEKERTIVTKEDIDNLEKIKKLIQSLEATDETTIDWANIELQSTIERVVYNLQNFSNYFKTIEETPGGPYNAECEKCGWFGSSEYCLGGHPIADTGDFIEVTCPVCNVMID
mgnify:CR=1 FL=1